MVGAAAQQPTQRGGEGQPTTKSQAKYKMNFNQSENKRGKVCWWLKRTIAFRRDLCFFFSFLHFCFLI